MMDDVIEEISKIDKLAFEREEENKAVLAKERATFEDKISEYRDEKIKEAKSHADAIYGKFVDEAKIETAENQAASEKKVEQLKLKFAETEEAVIEEIFETLFSVKK